MMLAEQLHSNCTGGNEVNNDLTHKSKRAWMHGCIDCARVDARTFV